MDNKPGKLSTAIYNKIVEQPGIGQEVLIAFAFRNFAGATEKQVIKALRNMCHSSKKIYSVGPRGKLAYLPSEETPPPAAAASSAVTKQEAKPAVRVLGEREFSLSLTDDIYLHLHLGEETVMLNPGQVERLKDFMDCITLKGAHA